MNPWRRFWGQSHRIYVNERHRRVHYERVADDILSVLPARGDAVVLDYGCGDALEAGRVATRVQRLYLFDAVAEVVTRLRERFAGQPGITVLDEAGLAALPPGSVDLVVVNSVVQYLRRDELDALLTTSRRVLKEEGTLIVADVIPPDAGAANDVASLLRTAWRHGFLVPALGGLVATFFSDYRRLRRSVGLATYTEAAFLDILSQGFDARRRTENLGFNAARMTFIASPRR